MTESTIEQVKVKLLEDAGFKVRYSPGGRFWIGPDGSKGVPDPISLDWLAKWCWAKMGKPVVTMYSLEDGWYCCEVVPEDKNMYKAYSATRVESAARATYAAIIGEEKR